MKNSYTKTWLRLVLLFLLLQIFKPSISSQTIPYECGFNPSLEEILSLEKIESDIQAFKTAYLRGNSPTLRSAIEMPIQAHVMRDDDGKGGADSLKILQMIDTLNKYFKPINVSFFLCGAINYVNNTDLLTQIDNREPNSLFPQRFFNRPNVINIYFTNSIAGGALGSAGFPNSENNSITITNRAINSITPVHEMGHYFGLYHTFGKGNSELCITNPSSIPTVFAGELVNGSNCAFAGDNICDTPASPCIRISSLDGCKYIGTAKDANGQLYKPDVSNIMEYSPDRCQNHFSLEQYARMLYFINGARSNKFCAPRASTYCTSKGLFTTDAWIEKVKLNNLVKISGDNLGYQNFTKDTIKVNRGGTYTLELVAGYGCGKRPVYWRVFVDFNQDNDFFDAGEIFYDQPAPSEEPVSLSIFMPRNAALGTTRIRVSMRFAENHHRNFRSNINYYYSAAPPMPCEDILNGEVEDYTLKIDRLIETNVYCLPKNTLNLSGVPSSINIGPFFFNYLNTGEYFFHKADTIELVRGATYPPIEIEPFDRKTAFIDFNRNRRFDFDGDIATGEFIDQLRPLKIPLSTSLGVTRIRIGSGIGSNGCDVGKDFVARIVDKPNFAFPLRSDYVKSLPEWREAMYIDSVLMITGCNGVNTDLTKEITIDFDKSLKHEKGHYFMNNQRKMTFADDWMVINNNGSNFFNTNNQQSEPSRFRPFSIFYNDFPNGLNRNPDGINRIKIGEKTEVEEYNLNVFNSSKCPAIPFLDPYKYGSGISDVKIDGKTIIDAVQPQSFSKKDSITLDLISYSKFPHKWYLWIDLNNDGVFDPKGETLFVSDTSSKFIKVKIPFPKLSVGPKKVRIKQIYAGETSVNANNPCAEYTYGAMLESFFYINDFKLVGSITYLPTESGVFPFHVPMNEKWSITGTPSWVSFYPTQGDGNDTIQLRYQQNENFSARKTEFTLTSSSFSKKIRITQLGSPITALPDTIFVDQKGGQFSYPLTLEEGTAPLQLFDTESWVKESLSGTNLMVDCQANHHFDRIGKLILRTKTGRTKRIVIAQKGADKPFFDFLADTIYLPGNKGGDTLLNTIITNDNYTFDWFSNWFTILIGVREDQLTTSTDLCTDNFYIRYTENRGTTARQTTVFFTTTTGIKKSMVIIQGARVITGTKPSLPIIELDNITIYPNPSRDHFIIDNLPQERGIINLYSGTGTLLHSKQFNSLNNENLSTPDLPSGIYFIEIRCGDKRVVKKALIQH
jgi:hypothetical protein